jgi:NAD(P)-dependent dehydrogenase (short-subunit alcohol dehydrogenase family)
VTAEIEASGGMARAVKMDHTRAHDCERTVATAVEAFGAVDVLVNNAGVAILGTALDVSEEDFVRQLRDQPARSLPDGARGAAANDRAAPRRDSEIDSAAGLHSRQAGAAYVSSKHAMVGLTKSFAVDYGGHGIRVNAVRHREDQAR